MIFRLVVLPQCEDRAGQAGGRPAKLGGEPGVGGVSPEVVLYRDRRRGQAVQGGSGCGVGGGGEGIIVRPGDGRSLAR